MLWWLAGAGSLGLAASGVWWGVARLAGLEPQLAERRETLVSRRSTLADLATELDATRFRAAALSQRTRGEEAAH